MRIVRLANYVAPHSGGLRTSLRELGAGYLAAGHEPVLIIPGPRDSDEQTPQGRVITLSGLRIPFTGGYRALLRKRRVAALLSELRPHTLEVSDRTTLRWTGRWARESGVPAVMISHESLTALTRMAVPGLDLPGLSRWGPTLAAVDAVNRRTVRAYQRVICTTAWAAAEFERIGAGNLLRAPLGVDLTTFAAPHHDQRGRRVRDTYAAPGETLLVHCGRLSPEKKPQRSLNTLATLRANGLPVRLVVAGDGPLRRRLERRAARDRLPVTFAGFLPDRSDLAALLASADVAIAPGPAETFGLAGLEALACGTPVVVSAESALPEVVGEAGASVAGEDLAAGVTTVLSWPEPARRATARARAEHFGWPAAVRAFLAIHEALVADEAGGGDRLTAGEARPGNRLTAGEARPGNRLTADEAGGRGPLVHEVVDGVASGGGRRNRCPDRAEADMTTFVALGDSITVGMGDPAPEGGGWRGWAALLGASLQQPVMHNLATLGALAVDVERLQLSAATDLKPDVASVVVGINDTLRGDFDPQRTGAAVARTVAGLRAAGAQVLTMRLPTRNPPLRRPPGWPRSGGWPPRAPRGWRGGPGT
jgi:alpha-1,6-mannosyltransferase